MTSAEQLASGTLTPALVLDVFLKLGIVLILIYLSLRLLRHFAQQASGLPGPQAGDLRKRLNHWLSPWVRPESVQSPIHTVQVHPLNRQVTLYLLEVESRRLLLSVSGSQVQLLSDWPSERPSERPTAIDTPRPDLQNSQATSNSQPYLNLHRNISDGPRRITDLPPDPRSPLPPNPQNSESEEKS